MLKKLTINLNLIVTTLPYIFMHFDVASPPPSSKYFVTCILNTFLVGYLYLYSKYFIKYLPITGGS